jgi:hypothetical protein
MSPCAIAGSESEAFESKEFSMNKSLIALSLAVLWSAPALADWEYRTRTDPMTDVTSHGASVLSTTPPRAAFLLVTSHPKNGNAAMIRVRDKVLACQRTCSVDVRFDDEPMSTVQVTELSGGGTLVMPAEPFIARAKSAKRIMVRVDLYREGPEIYTFNTAPLVWDR